MADKARTKMIKKYIGTEWNSTKLAIFNNHEPLGLESYHGDKLGSTEAKGNALDL